MISKDNFLLCHLNFADDVLFVTNYYFGVTVSLFNKI